MAKLDLGMDGQRAQLNRTLESIRYEFRFRNKANAGLALRRTKRHLTVFLHTDIMVI